ncbi:hypothetical protein AVEN_81417-1 [Araneus ventricosus]|uniref:Uncharacterized protein n=1 Tax=Araneus ventricosus TaxID=182803 RepID=A0A4Y2MT21_ARAVE|nr:hypothetical protein AVEN_81417-1 [Araneus ventricosus]
MECPHDAACGLVCPAPVTFFGKRARSRCPLVFAVALDTRRFREYNTVFPMECPQMQLWLRSAGSVTFFGKRLVSLPPGLCRWRLIRRVSV